MSEFFLSSKAIIQSISWLVNAFKNREKTVISMTEKL